MSREIPLNLFDGMMSDKFLSMEQIELYIDRFESALIEINNEPCLSEKAEILYNTGLASICMPPALEFSKKFYQHNCDLFIAHMTELVKICHDIYFGREEFNKTIIMFLNHICHTYMYIYGVENNPTRVMERIIMNGGDKRSSNIEEAVKIYRMQSND